MRLDDFKEAIDVYANQGPAEYPVTVWIDGRSVGIDSVEINQDGVRIYLDE